MVEGIPVKCNKTKRLLNMYLDKELPIKEGSEIKGHLKDCKKCNHYMAGLNLVKESIAGESSYNTNPFLWTRIKEAITEKPFIPGPLAIPGIVKLWMPIAVFSIFISLSVLHSLPTAQSLITKEPKTMETTILEVPITPENMEQITLNLIVYTNGMKGRFVKLSF